MPADHKNPAPSKIDHGPFGHRLRFALLTALWALALHATLGIWLIAAEVRSDGKLLIGSIAYPDQLGDGWVWVFSPDSPSQTSYLASSWVLESWREMLVQAIVAGRGSWGSASAAVAAAMFAAGVAAAVLVVPWGARRYSSWKNRDVYLPGWAQLLAFAVGTFVAVVAWVNGFVPTGAWRVNCMPIFPSLAAGQTAMVLAALIWAGVYVAQVLGMMARSARGRITMVALGGLAAVAGVVTFVLMDVSGTNETFWRTSFNSDRPRRLLNQTKRTILPSADAYYRPDYTAIVQPTHTWTAWQRDGDPETLLLMIELRGWTSTPSANALARMPPCGRPWMTPTQARLRVARVNAQGAVRFERADWVDDPLNSSLNWSDGKGTDVSGGGFLFNNQPPSISITGGWHLVPPQSPATDRWRAAILNAPADTP